MAVKPMCQAESCDNRSLARGFCQKHYARLLRHGSAEGGRRRPCPPRRGCDVEGCPDRHQAKGMCYTHYQSWKYHGFAEDKRPSLTRVPTKRVENGYVTWREPDHPAADASGNVLEHRAVMVDIVGRKLRPGENVHHKNGNRSDNRPENLELWVSLQPSGQRPDQLLAYAYEIVARYESEVGNG